MEHLIEILGAIGTFTGILSSLYLWRRNRRSEVRSKEATTADQMVDLVKKSFEQALSLNQREIEKLNKKITQLYRAVKAISSCPHRANCPVISELQYIAAGDERQREDTNGQRAHCRDPA